MNLWCFPHTPVSLSTVTTLAQGPPSYSSCLSFVPLQSVSMLHPDGLSGRLVRPRHALCDASESSLCLWRKPVLIGLVRRPFLSPAQPACRVSAVVTPLSHIGTFPALCPPHLSPVFTPTRGPLPILTNPSCPQYPGTYRVYIC